MGPEARFEIDRDGDGILVATYYDGHTDTSHVVATSDRGNLNEERFRWLVGSAATFHSIPVVDRG
jgi:hypothetical protein